MYMLDLYSSQSLRTSVDETSACFLYESSSSFVLQMNVCFDFVQFSLTSNDAV